MPPNTSSKAHYHREADIVVMCVQGWAATLVGPDLEARIHGPGEFIFVPAGVLHMAVNLSTVEVLVAVEARTDPHFNEDVVVCTELQSEAEEVAAALRGRFAIKAVSPEETSGTVTAMSHSSSPTSAGVVDVATRAFTP